MATLRITQTALETIPFNAVPVIRLESEKVRIPVTFESALNLDSLISLPVMLKSRQMAA
jgi:hypothetical protein